MYLRLKAPDHATLVAALKACRSGFVVRSEAGEDVIVQASHRHAIIHGLTAVSTPAVLDEDGNVVTDAVIAEGYHADLTGDAVTADVQATLEANGVEIVTPKTPQHVLG